MDTGANKIVFYLDETQPEGYIFLFGTNTVYNNMECLMWEEQASDFMKRKKMSETDNNYDPVWSPIQMSMNKVYEGEYKGFVWTKKQKEVVKNGG